MDNWEMFYKPLYYLADSDLILDIWPTRSMNNGIYQWQSFTKHRTIKKSFSNWNCTFSEVLLDFSEPGNLSIKKA